MKSREVESILKRYGANGRGLGGFPHKRPVQEFELISQKGSHRKG